MRAELENPFTDIRELQAVTMLAHEAYRLWEAGQDCGLVLNQLRTITGKPISKFSIDAAFGSVSPDTFARQMLLDQIALPRDLTRDEMLELIERECAAKGDEFQLGYWIKCLEVNTGDDGISDLIFWPGEYFADGNNSRELSAVEILDTALAKANVTHRTKPA